MAWTKTAIIDEETFAGPSVEQFVEFEGVFQRLLNLNQVGSWQTMWIVMLMSAHAIRKDLYAPSVGVNRDNPYWEKVYFGLRSSSSSYIVDASAYSRTYHYPNGRQWLGVHNSLSGSPQHAVDSSGDYWFDMTGWRYMMREDGTQVVYSGGFSNSLSLETGPSIRRPWALTIVKDTTTKLGCSVPQGTGLSDYTKADCKNWLLGSWTSSINFIFNRPSGNSYGPSADSGYDIDEGTYGSLNTIFFACNKPGILWRCHGIWGRVFATVF